MIRTFCYNTNEVIAEVHALPKAIHIDTQVESICLLSLYSLLDSISKPNEIHFNPKVSHHKQMEHIFLFTYTIRPFQ